MPTTIDLFNRFVYHAPTPEQTDRYGKLRGCFFDLATTIDLLVPESREKSLAMINLEQAMFWANAAIARNEPAAKD
jgi:hypothetical protein